MTREEAFKLAYEEYREFGGEKPSAMGLRGAIDAYVAALKLVIPENEARSMTLSPQTAQALLEAAKDFVAAMTPEINEKGAGGYALARLHDLRSAIASAEREIQEGKNG